MIPQWLEVVDEGPSHKKGEWIGKTTYKGNYQTVLGSSYSTKDGAKVMQYQLEEVTDS